MKFILILAALLLIGGALAGSTSIMTLGWIMMAFVLILIGGFIWLVFFSR